MTFLWGKQSGWICSTDLTTFSVYINLHSIVIFLLETLSAFKYYSVHDQSSKIMRNEVKDIIDLDCGNTLYHHLVYTWNFGENSGKLVGQYTLTYHLGYYCESKRGIDCVKTVSFSKYRRQQLFLANCYALVYQSSGIV